MRILHILDHSLPLHSGYTFRTRAIMKAQLAKGWDVIGVTGYRHTAPGPVAETVEDLNFERTPGARSGPPVISELREIAALTETIKRTADVFKPDILHAHSPVLGALAALKANRQLNLPFIYEIRAFWEDASVGNGTGREGSMRFRATRGIESWAVNRADEVAVICEGLKGDLIKRGVAADKILVSPNGVDLDLFGDPMVRDEALAKDLDLPLDGDTIGFIGSFYDYEGLDDLLSAMPAMVAKRPKLTLIMVGGGPMDDNLRAQAASSPVADHIRFVGRVPHDMVERYYSLIDVLVYPRKAMRLTDLVTPMKPLEAMAQRRLVAASNVGGHRELIEDGVTGTLFAPDNPSALAQSVVNLLNDREHWSARRDAGYAFIKRERNWSSNISRYEPVYQRLIKERR
jgi:glycogen synthase